MSLALELQSLGLTSREVDVYLAMANLGKCTAQLVSKRIKMPRTTVYLVLEGLERRGLIMRESKSNTTFFTPRPPQSLLEMLKVEQDEIRRRSAHAERLVKELEPLFKHKNYNIPKLRFVEGASLIQRMLYQYEDDWYRSMAETDCTWWGFEDASLYKGYRAWFEHMWNKFSDARSKKIKLRIFSNFPASEYLEERFPLTKIRPLLSTHDFSSTTWVMGNHMVIFSTRQKPFYGYQFYDPVLAENLRIIFKMLWEKST